MIAASQGAASKFDILIVGAGMVGLTLAAALAKTSLTVGLIEARDLSVGPGADGRSSALALGTIRLLDQLGAWSMMQALGVSPIYQIQVSDGQFSGISRLSREDIQVEALGYIVENTVTQTALRHLIHQADNIQLMYPATVQAIQQQTEEVQVLIDYQGELRSITAQLVVGADGSRSLIRHLADISCSDWPYRQACVVTTVTTEQPHHHVAYERFQPSGPFAILPMVGLDPSESSCRSCVVWTIRSQDRDQIMSLKDEPFIQTMMPAFGEHLGQITSVSSRACYQPRRLHSHCYYASRVALVGDAAHSTHPVGGQGVNMGMRDVALLATLLSQAHYTYEDVGSPDLLKIYNRARRLENGGVLLGTDLANRLFSNQVFPLQWSRRLGLIGLNWIPPVKKLIMRQAMGIAPYQPQLKQDAMLQPVLTRSH